MSQNSALVKLTDRLGQTTTLAYDAERELVSSTDALGNSTKYGYSGTSKLTSMTDPNGHATSWTRDLEGRVTGKTYAENTSQAIAYEATANDSPVERVPSALRPTVSSRCSSETEQVPVSTPICRIQHLR